MPAGLLLRDTAELTMMADDFTTISVTRDARGESALQYLQDPRTDADEPPQLLLQAAGAVKADAYTGAALRARIAGHLAAGGGRGVSLWLPDAEPEKALLADLIGPLPENCSLPQDMKAPSRSGDVLVPGSVLETLAEADDVALFLRMTAHWLGVDPGEANLLAQGLLTFAHNGLMYAPGSSCKTVVCASVDRETSQASVVAVDQGQSVCASGKEVELLRAAFTSSEERFGGLASLRDLAEQVDIPTTISLHAGEARLRRPGTTRGDLTYVSGWCSALTVQIRGRRRRRIG